MSKFVFLFYGQSEPTADVSAAWHAWFTSIGDKIIDSGNPFGPGREVSTDGSTDLTADMHPATGYSIVSADSLDEAEKLLVGCPAASARVFEAMPM
jgi:hypothetical protein